MEVHLKLHRWSHRDTGKWKLSERLKNTEDRLRRCDTYNQFQGREYIFLKGSLFFLLLTVFFGAIVGDLELLFQQATCRGWQQM